MVEVLGSTLAVAQEPWGIDRLMAELAKVKSASAQFTERKTMHMLTEPLILSGRLVYVAPDHMEKITTSPTSEKLVMDGDQITIVTGPDSDTHTFSLAQYPQIGGLVAGIRATMAGDLGTLDRFYVARLMGTASAWDLQLVPKDADLTHFVKWIDFRGGGDRIHTIDTEDADGDHSDMTIVEDGSDGG
jgi:outer membrane lipoprotein-sorting protein